MDGAYCKIIGAFDKQETPLMMNIRDGKKETVVLLSHDAYANDAATLEGKGFKPTNFMLGIAEAVLSGPFIMEYNPHML